MAHILLLDDDRRTAEVADRVFRTMGHRGSISTRRSDGMAKLSTGLFDILYVDISPTHFHLYHQFVMRARGLAPRLPLVRVVEPRLAEVVSGGSFDINRPIRIEDLLQAMRRAVARLAHYQAERRRHERSPVDLTVEVLGGDRSLPARLLDLSVGGLRIELAAFEMVEHLRGPIAVALQGQEKSVRLSAEIVHSELGVEGGPRLGLAFGDPEMLEEEIRRMIRAA